MTTTAVGVFRNTIYGPIHMSFVEVTLGSLCVGKNGVQTGPFGSQLHQRDYVEVGTPIITVEHLGENQVLHQNLPLVSDEDRDRLSRYQMQTGDIIFSRVGSVDRRSLVREPEDGWLFSGRCLRARPDKKKADPYYLSAFMGLSRFKDYMRQIAVGATMPSINTDLLANVPIFVPARREQQTAIGEFVRIIDDKIFLNQQMNETLEGMARAIFKDWFVDFGPVRAKERGERPIGPDGEPMSDELLSLFPDRLDPDTGLPDGRVEKFLSDFADLNPESWTKKTAPDALEYVDLANTKWGTIETTEHYHWADAPSRARRVLRPGDTIVGTVRPGNGSYALVSLEGLTGSTGFAVLRPKTRDARELVYCAATSPENIDSLTHLADGGAYPAVRPDVVVSTPVCVGNERLVQMFSRVVAPLLDLAEHNKKLNQTLANLRDTLLPKLMSGEVSVDEIKAIDSAANAPAQPIGTDLFGEVALTPDEELERETVMVSAAVKALQVEDQVVGNVRYQKAVYFTRRRMDLPVDDFLPKAAGPYNHELKYGGGYEEALKRQFIRTKRSGDIEGNVTASNIAGITPLVAKYQMDEAITWVRDHLRGKSRDELELWATVDQAALLLGKMDKEINVDTVVDLIGSISEWKPKLNRPVFCRASIAQALSDLNRWLET